jgi:hypothetical protein
MFSDITLAAVKGVGSFMYVAYEIKLTLSVPNVFLCILFEISFLALWNTYCLLKEANDCSSMLLL